MSSFRGDFLRRAPIPMSAAWLLSDIAEAKGRQSTVRAVPQVLTTLREAALVQSVESSNRIEGITVAPGRLRPLVLGDDRPRDRSEEEILGYRRALERVHFTPAISRSSRACCSTFTAWFRRGPATRGNGSG